METEKRRNAMAEAFGYQRMLLVEHAPSGTTFDYLARCGGLEVQQRIGKIASENVEESWV
jgi:hypothetical protein